MSRSVTQLFQAAGEENLLSAPTVTTLSGANVGTQIAAALKGSMDVESIQSSEVLLTGVLVDDSGSITCAQSRGKGGRFGPTEDHSQLVRDGCNAVIDALMGSKQLDSILTHCRYLNGTVLYPFVPLKQAVRMDDVNYQANGGTPLYDQSVVFLGTILAKAKEFDENGVPVRTASLIVTDGRDEHSRKHGAKDVFSIVADMLRQETHIIAGMGIDDGGNTDFWEIFCGIPVAEIEQAKAAGTLATLRPRGGMGILPRFILTPGNNAKELRAAFQVFSQSAVRASQNAGSFSQVALGGFGK